MLRFTIERGALIEPLILASGIAEKKQGLAILANVLLRVDDGLLKLNATDSEVEIATRIDLSTPALASGETTVPAKKLIDICRSLSDNDVLNFEQKEGKLMIKAGKSRFSLATLPADEFPDIQEDVKQSEFTIDTNLFKQLLQSTYFSMAQQDVRYYLNGVYLKYASGVLTSVATDGHRLAECEIPFPSNISPFEIIFPRKGVTELVKLLDSLEEEQVLVSISENHIYVDSKKHTFISKLVNGKYPNYSSVIPQNNDKSVIVDRDVLKKSLSRVAILSNEKYRGVLFNVLPCKLTIEAHNPEQEEAEEEIEVTTEGDVVKIGFNVNYMLDVLNNIPKGNVKLSFSTPEHSVLIESFENQYVRYVVMPMKI